MEDVETKVNVRVGDDPGYSEGAGEPLGGYVKPDHQIPDHSTPDRDPVAERMASVRSAYPNFDEKPEVSSFGLTQETAEPTAPEASSLTMPADDRPVPVVKVLSVRGVEYAMMSILLWIGAGSLIFILTSMIMGSGGFEMLAMPISLLLVCLPGFGYLFLRLRKGELADPSLRLEGSKRRFSQITQILAFLTCFFNIVTVVYMLIGMAGGNEVSSIGKTLGAAAVVLVIAGGILAYYWADEHKLAGRN